MSCSLDNYSTSTKLTAHKKPALVHTMRTGIVHTTVYNKYCSIQHTAVHSKYTELNTTDTIVHTYYTTCALHTHTHYTTCIVHYNTTHTLHYTHTTNYTTHTLNHIPLFGLQPYTWMNLSTNSCQWTKTQTWSWLLAYEILRYATTCTMKCQQLTN